MLPPARYQDHLLGTIVSDSEDLVEFLPGRILDGRDILQCMKIDYHCPLGMYNCSISPRLRLCLAFDSWHASSQRQGKIKRQINQDTFEIDITAAVRRNVRQVFHSSELIPSEIREMDHVGSIHPSRWSGQPGTPA